MTLHKTGSAHRPIRIRIAQEVVSLDGPHAGGMLWPVSAFLVTQRDCEPGADDVPQSLHVESPEAALAAAEAMATAIRARGYAAHVYRGQLPHSWAGTLDHLPRA